MASHDAIDLLAKDVAYDLLEDATLDVAFEVHRSLKRGLLMLEMGSDEEEQKFLQVTAEGLDVFGQAPVRKQHECVCPNCSRNLAASRFAPHLEKCMGMGRNSSRIASRRIQNSSRENNSANPGGGSDDDDDDDWVADRKRRKRDKNSPRRSKNVKLKGECVSSSSSANNSNSSNNTTPGNLEAVLSSASLEEKKVLLHQICGVISEHTHKMCTRSLRCPQHTNDQRRMVREQFLGTGDIVMIGTNGSGNAFAAGPTVPSLGSATTARAADSTTAPLGSRLGLGDSEDIQVEIDGLDDGQLGSSWEHDLSNTTSPADSTSTNNSTSSVNKRSNNTKSKKKSSKSSKSSTSSLGSLLD